MLLLQIYSLTYIYTTFNIAYYLLSSEKEGYFTQVLDILQFLLTDYKIPCPQVIIIDFDKAFKKACRRVFNSDVQYQICLQYVIKNVVFNTKKKQVGSLEGTSLGEQGSDGSYLREEDNSEFDVNPVNFDKSAR